MKKRESAERRDLISTMYLFFDIVLFFVILLTVGLLYIANSANHLKKERIAELSGAGNVNAITIDGAEAEKIPGDYYLNYDASYNAKTKTVALKTAPESLEQTYLHWRNYKQAKFTKR